MGKDKRPWRKLVKKLRRKRIRTAAAIARDQAAEEEAVTTRTEEARLQYDSSTDSDDSDAVELVEHESGIGFLSKQAWEVREKATVLELQKRKEAERQAKEKEEAEKEKLRKEWEATEARLKAELEEAKRLEEERQRKQEEEYNQFLDFLCGDVETPPTKFIMPDEVDLGDKELCASFARTATCRFGLNCRKAHRSPTLSQIIMIPNFFTHYSLEQALSDEFDADLNLEYNDGDLYKSFLEFYDDVLPEFRKFGEVTQFKVCCNYEPHVRGNVYVQYKNIREAVEAYRVFNGRYFNGKQISLNFVRIESWRSAICGMFSRKKCKMKLSCNFLHVFRNPTKEFVLADNDWKPKVANAPAAATFTPSRQRLGSISIQHSGIQTPSVSILHTTAQAAVNGVTPPTASTPVTEPREHEDHEVTAPLLSSSRSSGRDKLSERDSRSPLRHRSSQGYRYRSRSRSSSSSRRGRGRRRSRSHSPKKHHRSSKTKTSSKKKKRKHSKHKKKH